MRKMSRRVLTAWFCGVVFLWARASLATCPSVEIVWPGDGTEVESGIQYASFIQGEELDVGIIPVLVKYSCCGGSQWTLKLYSTSPQPPYETLWEECSVAAPAGTDVMEQLLWDPGRLAIGRYGLKVVLYRECGSTASAVVVVDLWTTYVFDVMQRGQAGSLGQLDIRTRDRNGNWYTLKYKNADASYSCVTHGVGEDECSHQPPHTYCVNQDTPPYPLYPPEQGGAEVVRYETANENNTDFSYNGKWYFRARRKPTGSILGYSKFILPNQTAPCGCYRTLLRIHGGAPRSYEDEKGVGKCLEDNQEMHNTLGCIRVYNVDLDQKLGEFFASRVGKYHCKVYIHVPQ